MRYYRYGSDSAARELEVKEDRGQITNRHFDELIIDEDTIYEIDEECIRCRENKKDCFQKE